MFENRLNCTHFPYWVECKKMRIFLGIFPKWRTPPPPTFRYPLSDFYFFAIFFGYYLPFETGPCHMAASTYTPESVVKSPPLLTAKSANLRGELFTTTWPPSQNFRLGDSRCLQEPRFSLKIPACHTKNRKNFPLRGKFKGRGVLYNDKHFFCISRI